MNQHDVEILVESVKTEADVLLVFISVETDTVRVVPYWECEETPEQLFQMLVEQCVYYADKNGQGDMQGYIIDRREPETIAERTE